MRVSRSILRIADLERFQGVGQILALSIQVLLALGLLLEFADCGKVHLAQTLDFSLRVLELRLPRGHRGVRCNLRHQRREIEIRCRQLLCHAFAANAHLLSGQARLIETGAGRLQALIHRNRAASCSRSMASSSSQAILAARNSASTSAR